MFSNTEGRGVFQLLYKSRFSDLDSAQTIIESMNMKFGEDFFQRVLNKGVFHQLLADND